MVMPSAPRGHTDLAAAQLESARPVRSEPQGRRFPCQMERRWEEPLGN